MAVKIPIYEQQTTASGGIQVGASPQLSARSNVGAVSMTGGQSIANAVENLGNAAVNFAGMNLHIMKQKEDADAVANLSDSLSKADVFWYSQVKDLPQNMVDGGQIKIDEGKYIPATEKVAKDFDEWAGGFLAGVTNEKAAYAARRHIATLREQTLKSSMMLEAQAAVQNRSDKVDGAVENWKSLAAQTPALADQLIESSKLMIANSGFNEHDRVVKAKKAEQEILEAAASNYMLNQPKQFMASLHRRVGKEAEAAASAPGADGQPAASPVVSASGGTFDRAVEFTLKAEGGFNPNDSNNAPSNFGINQGANPDVDVKGLTKDKAIELYKSRYWNKIGGDELAAKDPRLAIVAFDTAVMAGVGKAKELLAKADGDVDKLYNLRKEFLDGLVAKNPQKYGKYAKAWNNRNDQILDVTTGMGSEPLRVEIDGVGAMLPAEVKNYPVDWQVQMLVDKLPQDKILTYIHATTSEVNRQQAQFQSALTVKEKDHELAFAQGLPVDRPLTQQEFVNAYGDKDGLARFAQYSQNMVLGKEIAAVKTMPPDQARALIDSHKPDPNSPGYALEVGRKAVLEKAVAETQQQRDADPVLYAAQNKLANVKPINWNNLEEAKAELANRVGVANIMVQRYGTPMQPLTKQEAANLAAGFDRMTADEKLRFLGTMRAAVQDSTVYRSMVQQIQPDSVVTAMAGMVMDQKTPVVVKHFFSKDDVYQPNKVAQLMLEGEAILNPTKGAKGQDGKGGKFPLPKDTDFEREFANQVGTAFAGSPKAMSDAMQGVKAYYVGQAAREGDLSDVINGKRMKAAIEAVTGGVTSLNGKEVIRPWGMDEGAFKDGIKSGFDQEIKARGMVVSFGAVTFQNTAGGGYLAVNGDTYLTDPKTGRAIVVMPFGPGEMPKSGPAPAAPVSDRADKTNTTTTSKLKTR